ncbi:MAG: hypothetical protein ACP5GI_02135 [Sulfolobales archaeon]
MSKKTSIVSTRRSKEIAKLYELRILADYIEEELDCEKVQVHISPDIEKAYLILIQCSEKLDNRSIDELINELNLLQWSSNTLLITYDSHYSFAYYSEDLIMNRILRYITHEIIDDFRESLKSFIHNAFDKEIEYLFILHRKGEWLILEGEKYRINIPRINDVIASIHTHPTSSCIPSRADLESMIDLLTSGGVLFGIVSRTCLFTAELINFINEYTYERLMRLLNNYDDFIQFLKRASGDVIRIGEDLILKVRYKI